MNRVLILAGDEQLSRSVETLLLDRDLTLVTAASLEAGLAAVDSRQPDLVLLLQPLGPHSAAATLRSLHAKDPRLPVIILTAATTTEEAIEVTKAGAFDYLLAPAEESELLTAVEQGLEAGRLMRSPVALDHEARGGSGDALVGRSRAMQEVYKAIGRVAATDATVLVRGESGTGKELVARAIYQHSARAARPFVVVNCVAIPETLLESELFGYERGAFTGAVASRIGKVKQADGGTLFLDEIGDMPPPIQAKLLRLLEDRSIEPIGSRRPVPVDVRILAATNRDLEAAMDEDRFRTDLFYRLNVVPIKLPPLRERLEDLPLLCDYFLGRLTTELGVRNPGLTAEAAQLLASHHWPGNVRELANAMEQLLIFSRGRQIGVDEVASLVLGPAHGTAHVLSVGDEALRRWVHESVAFGRDRLLPAITDHVSQRVIREVLEITGGNRLRAARLLGISRPTLLAKIKKYGLG